MDRLRRIKKSILQRLDPQSQTLIQNSTWVFGANGVATVIGMLRSIVIARGLGIELFGTFVLLSAFVDTTREFFDLNFYTPIIKFGAEYVAQDRRDKLVALIKVMCLTSVILSAAAFVITCMLALAWKDRLKLTQPGFFFVVGYAIASNLSVFQGMAIAVLRLFFRFRTNAMIRTAVDVFEFLCLVAVLLVFPKNLSMFFVAFVSARIISNLAIVGAAYHEIHQDMHVDSSVALGVIRDDKHRISSFTFSNSINRTVQTLMTNGDVLLVGMLAGERQAGLYSIAKKLAHTLLRLTDPLMNSIFPQLAQLATENKFREIARLVSKSSKTLAIPCLGFLVGGYLLKDWIMLIYGSEYAEAAWPFFVQQMIATLGALAFWSLPLIQSLGLMGKRFILLSLAIVTGGAVAWLIVPQYGAVGGSIASLVAKAIVELGTVTAIVYHLRKKSTGEHTQPT